jgi:predicted nucleic acid-binding protein
MAKIKLLIDTDILIDFLKGIRVAKELFKTRDIDLYCSVLSKKELLSKEGLRNSEKELIFNLLSKIKVLKIDGDINRKYVSLIKKYGEKPERLADYIIAATAWSKRLPLLTRNRKHFAHIKEITLSPGYVVE